MERLPVADSASLLFCVIALYLAHRHALDVALQFQRVLHAFFVMSGLVSLVLLVLGVLGHGPGTSFVRPAHLADAVILCFYIAFFDAEEWRKIPQRVISFAAAAFAVVVALAR